MWLYHTHHPGMAYQHCNVLCMRVQNISNAAWAFGRLGMQHPELFSALSAVSKASKLEGFNNQNITDLAWGFAEAGNQVGIPLALPRTAHMHLQEAAAAYFHHSPLEEGGVDSTRSRATSMN